MAKVKIKVTGAYVDGHAPGSEISVEEKSAKYLESVGYAEIVKEQVKATPKKTTSSTRKKTTQAKSESK